VALAHAQMIAYMYAQLRMLLGIICAASAVLSNCSIRLARALAASPKLCT
jgi:hypothetical protein